MHLLRILQKARVFLNANWEEAKCANEATDLRIKNFIREARGGFEGFAARLVRVATGPFIREAAFVGDAQSIAEVQRLCSRPGFLINSNVLKGGLGETAVHIAAAAGNLAMLEMLLGHGADPNAEDHLRETPLHYAAMTGKAGSIRLLLKHGAEPQVESAFAETPLCVAEQNPAAFLGIRTEKAAELLKVWAAAAQTQDSDAAYEARDQKTNVKPKEGGT
jgi:hypothetical protein